MTQPHERTVLFLCTGNYYRSRYAESFFNSAAERIDLPWRATSRGLALELGVNNVGPMAASAIKALEARGLFGLPEFRRFPLQVSLANFEAAHWIVALKQTEHLPLLEERFPAWTAKVEFWHVDDAPEVLKLIERQVIDLARRLMEEQRQPEAPIAGWPSFACDLILRLIADLPSEQLDPWQTHAVRLGALPIGGSMWSAYYLRPNGQVIVVDEYYGRPGLDSVHSDWKRALSMLVWGAERYPDLRALLPVRRLDSVICPCSASPLFAERRLLCPECGGLGWMASPEDMPDSDAPQSFSM